MSEPLTWNATPEGYERSDAAARLVRGPKKTWRLVLANGAEHPLPRRASFDHADALMGRLAVAS